MIRWLSMGVMMRSSLLSALLTTIVPVVAEAMVSVAVELRLKEGTRVWVAVPLRVK